MILDVCTCPCACWLVLPSFMQFPPGNRWNSLGSVLGWSGRGWLSPTRWGPHSITSRDVCRQVKQKAPTQLRILQASTLVGVQGLSPSGDRVAGRGTAHWHRRGDRDKTPDSGSRPAGRIHGCVAAAARFADGRWMHVRVSYQAPPFVVCARIREKKTGARPAGRSQNSTAFPCIGSARLQLTRKNKRLSPRSMRDI